MRWKLANGGIVGTTKQPLQWKDFDRIVITDDSSQWGTFEDDGIPGPGDIEFTVKLYNPSTHTIRKSYHTFNTLNLFFETVAFGNDGSRFTNVTSDDNGRIEDAVALQGLDYGDVFTWYVYPEPAILNGHWSQRVTPWNIERWGGSDIYDFYPNSFDCHYVIKLTNANIGGRPSAHKRTLKKFLYTVTYKIR